MRKKAAILLSKYDCVALPQFESQRMASRSSKLHKRTRFEMLTLGHNQLQQKAEIQDRAAGKARVHSVREVHDAGMHQLREASAGGRIQHKFVQRYCSAVLGRDVNGARNIWPKNIAAGVFCACRKMAPFLLGRAAGPSGHCLLPWFSRRIIDFTVIA